MEYTAMFDPTDEELVMNALNAAVKGYVEDEAEESVEDPAGSDDWEKEYIEAWAEERKAARAFTADFSEKLSDRDLRTFVMHYGDEYHYVLGKTTLKDMMEDGWIPDMEDIGVFSLYDINRDPTGILLYTEHGTLDEPIITMDAMFQEFMQVEYCGFDGAVGIYEDDPDQYWYPDQTGLDLADRKSVV